MFHRGLSKKQFLTLGYTYLTHRRGVAPTCRNVLELMKEHGAFDRPKSGEYQNMRSTFQQLEHQHKMVDGKTLGLLFCPANSKPANGFYPTERGVEVIKSYVEGQGFF